MTFNIANVIIRIKVFLEVVMGAIFTEATNLQIEVKEHIEKLLAKLDIDQYSLYETVDELKAPVLDGLREVVEAYTIQNYEFNLSMGFFVQMAHDKLEEVLKAILASVNLIDRSAKQDINFAVYYGLSMILKKNKKSEELSALKDRRYGRAFGAFPLYYEVLSRCYKSEKNYKEALRNDKIALDKLPSGIENAGLLISYASTVCAMIRNRDPELQEDHITKAKEYVDRAIKQNASYQKYPFVKAELIFLSAMRAGGDPALLVNARAEALALIDKSEELFNQAYDAPRYLEDYEDFRNFMKKTIAELRFPKTYAELDALKVKILNSSSHKECSSANDLPYNPELHPEDKYFFICYSSQDFKSVYCDLIELYRSKVHFMYDRRLDNDEDWEKQVEKKINDDSCVGVVFYISENILSGEAVQNEIDIVLRSGKPRFRLNLENDAPSRILINYLLKMNADPEKPRYYLSDKKMRLFLNCFDDNGVFADKMKEKGDNGTAHHESYIESLEKSFSNEIIGE